MAKQKVVSIDKARKIVRKPEPEPPYGTMPRAMEGSCFDVAAVNELLRLNWASKPDSNLYGDVL